MSTTESASHYNSLEQMPVRELLENINREDKTVPLAIEKAIPQLEALVNATVTKLSAGGRLFYIGAGTSGRLGIVDASECPPTYGVPHGMVIGIIAGGDTAIRKAVEFAEDDAEQAWKDLQEHNITAKDIVVGIAASGRTPYVIGGLEASRAKGIATGCIVCNPNSAVAAAADFPVEVVTGPEFVTGSTRMKAGTAQKLALNMLTTATMVRLGRVKGNKMVDMQLSNHKLVDRGIRMVMDELQLPQPEAAALLKKYGNVRAAIDAYTTDDPSKN
ncbi:N-acetylmuramic acid 6-phosphate etherase [Pontibacter arcticus]|uniref:N-acetylmuramic acid 6-phosphate etherase n=1 Tax=Pontibacter arcticus TaxID=2080288 RepID=A0A364RB28_9BACT|nr:N-acetylmuramic acid 6-phosphate etherase [Pontibacter arcticus]RAU81503.1 N-acetylmuramic acid 6-phosphate etherase [Pontibacter arcticus]